MCRFLHHVLRLAATFATVIVFGGAVESAIAECTLPSIGPIFYVSDFNGDGRADIFDLDILGRNWGRTDASFADGDATGDGIVNLFDLDILGLQFASCVASDDNAHAASGAASVVTTPEPSTAFMLGALFASLSCCLPWRYRR